MALNWGMWMKYNILAGSSDLAANLPKTRKMSKRSFWSMLDQYGKVIVKPLCGQGGLGVIQVSAKENDDYEIHFGKRKKQ